MPNGPITIRGAIPAFVPPAAAVEVPAVTKDPRGDLWKQRASGPPAPPAPFVPPLDPRADPRLHAEHERLRPTERFRAGSTTAHPGVPPQILNGQPPGGLLGSKPAAAPVEAANPNYPKARYHKAAGVMIVKDPDHEAEATPDSAGWQSKPFPADKVPSTQERLELLYDLILTLSEQAEEKETPRECLDRIILERDDFAKKLAAEK